MRQGNNPQIGVLSICIQAKSLFQGAAVAPDELVVSVENHLRRIGTFLREFRRIDTLPICEGLRRIWVSPAQAVPVRDMLAEPHDELPSRGLFEMNLLQKRVGRRTTGTPFGGEQFHDRDRNRLFR
jgi:hypothetical protein